MSRHYYDTLMLAHKGIADEAQRQPNLLARVVHNKSLMFADNSASYETAVLGSLRLTPSEEIKSLLKEDYSAMSEMFMKTPPTFADLIAGIADLEARINSRAVN